MSEILKHCSDLGSMVEQWIALLSQISRVASLHLWTHVDPDQYKAFTKDE